MVTGLAYMYFYKKIFFEDSLKKVPLVPNFSNGTSKYLGIQT